MKKILIALVALCSLAFSSCMVEVHEDLTVKYGFTTITYQSLHSTLGELNDATDYVISVFDDEFANYGEPMGDGYRVIRDGNLNKVKKKAKSLAESAIKRVDASKIECLKECDECEFSVIVSSFNNDQETVWKYDFAN